MDSRIDFLNGAVFAQKDGGCACHALYTRYVVRGISLDSLKVGYLVRPYPLLCQDMPRCKFKGFLRKVDASFVHSIGRIIFII